MLRERRKIRAILYSAISFQSNNISLQKTFPTFLFFFFQFEFAIFLIQFYINTQGNLKCDRKCFSISRRFAKLLSEYFNIEAEIINITYIFKTEYFKIAMLVACSNILAHVQYGRCKEVPKNFDLSSDRTRESVSRETVCRKQRLTQINIALRLAREDRLTLPGDCMKTARR